MSRFILGLTACVLGLGLAGTAAAHEPYHGHHEGYVHSRPYYMDHGVRFHGGYYYPGENHHHWEYKVWDAGCHCFHYYDPYLGCFYYFNPEFNCYYPVGY